MQQTRTSINKLKSTHEITHKSTSKYTVISICNWDIYQNGEEEDNTLSNKRATNEQQTSNKQVTTNKNEKNDKNEKKEDNKKPAKKLAPIDLILPYPSEIFREAWDGLLEVRKYKKAPPTERALKGILKKIAGLSRTESEAIRLLDRAIQSGWVTVYPDRATNRDRPDPEAIREKEKIIDEKRMVEIGKRLGIKMPDKRLDSYYDNN